MSFLAGFAPHGQVPVFGALAEWDVFDAVPEVLPEASIAQKTPVLILPQQLVSPIMDYSCGCSFCLGVGARHSNQEGRRMLFPNIRELLRRLTDWPSADIYFERPAHSLG